jgi:hypothetical protein
VQALSCSRTGRRPKHSQGRVNFNPRLQGNENSGKLTVLLRAQQARQRPGHIPPFSAPPLPNHIILPPLLHTPFAVRADATVIRWEPTQPQSNPTSQQGVQITKCKAHCKGPYQIAEHHPGQQAQAALPKGHVSPTHALKGTTWSCEDAATQGALPTARAARLIHLDTLRTCHPDHKLPSSHPT